MHELITILLLGLIVYFAYTVGMVAGFGPTVLAVPLLLLLKDIVYTRALVTLFGTILSVTIVIRTYTSINKRVLGSILLFAGMGLPVGFMMFSYFNRTVLMVILGIFTLFVSLRGIIHTTFQRGEKYFSKYTLYLLVFIGGIFHGAFNTGGPLIIIYTSQVLKDKLSFRATQMAVWTILNISIILQILISGVVSRDVYTIKNIKEYVLISPFLVLALLTGGYLEKRVSQIFFRKLIYILLFFSACSILISNLL